MDKAIPVILNIVLVVVLYLSYIDKYKISNTLTDLLIKNKIPEKDLNLNLKEEIESIKLINKKYKIGLHNSKKVFESLKK